jgi:uncharacterized protein
MAPVKTFDDLEIRRPELARSYLKLLEAQPGRPIALFAPRRVGKTFFLDQDLAPAAKAKGYVAVYADVWLQRAAPLDAINHALEEALDDATVPAGAVGKAVKTPVKKLGGMGASLEFGDEPKRRPLPHAAELRLDALVTRLHAAAGRPVLLMLDEVQSLGEHPDGPGIIATLRAVSQKRKREVLAVFTGSSQEALSAMMAASGGPMYQFAQLVNFPSLGDEYLALLAEHFARVHPGKRLELAALREAFDHIGHKPALMKDLVKAMSAEGSTDVELALTNLVQDDRQVVGWRALLAGMTLLERALLAEVANGQAPMGQVTLARLGKTLGIAPTIAKVRSALERLKRAGVLAKGGGGFVIEDRLFADYVSGAARGPTVVGNPRSAKRLRAG